MSTWDSLLYRLGCLPFFLHRFAKCSRHDTSFRVWDDTYGRGTWEIEIFRARHPSYSFISIADFSISFAFVWHH